MADDHAIAPNPIRGVIYIITAAAAFTAMGGCLKYAMTAIPLSQAVFFRSGFSSVVLGLIVYRRGLPFRGNAQRTLWLRCITGFSSMCCGFYALAHIPFAEASVLRHTAPLFVALFATRFLGEPVTRALVVKIGIAMAGVLFILRPGIEMVQLAAVAGLLGGMLGGLAYVFVRRLHSTDHWSVIAFHFTSFATLASAPFAIWQFVVPTQLQLAALLGAGAMGTVGQIMLTGAYRYDEAARLAPFSYSAVLIAVGVGWLFFDEIPDVWSWGGIFLIITAGVCIARSRTTAPATEESA